ncbi:MAG: hypothetical protein K6G67_09260 [Lachnospiraceae bacterium]|nr:hypothetical protein [Lachnospiraceae bacterium]
MTGIGIGASLIGSYTAAKTAYVPKNVKQVVAGFASKDENDKQKADVSNMKRALRRGCENLAKETNVSVIDNMQMYSRALKKQRESSKNTELAKKKVKYSFKRISSKIISSKTSTAAREAVSQARREIQKLKAARRTGKYDEEELEAAIDHAKSMERIARKKARHLEEEEMAKRCSSEEGPSAAGAVSDDDIGDKNDPVEEEIKKLREELRGISDKADNGEYIESEEITNEMISEITDSMEEMLDSIEELGDLMDELLENPVDMDPEDIKAMTIKHRNKEMKEITKADADYLKAMFEHYENIKAEGSMSTSSIDVAL